MNDSIFEHQFIVAKLDDIQGILGMDFLEQYDVVIKASQNRMVISDRSIDLEQTNSDICARVRLSKEVIIPPKSEVLTSGYVDKSVPNQNVIVEPYKSLGNKGLLLCRSLVDPNSVKLSVMNVGDKPVKLLCDTAVANLEEVEDVKEVEPESKSRENENCSVPEYLQTLLDSVSPKLSDEQREKVAKFLIEFQDVFVSPEGNLGRTDVVRHTIDTGNTRPIKIPPRRLHVAQREIVEKELDKMLKNDIIEPSSSPWSSPLLLVVKKDGSVRFCVDFRRLNSVTRKDAYPLPKIDETLDTLSGASWFSTLDLASGFWQCQMHENDREKTAFSTHKGLFQFKVMPFGLCNAPATFERLMELVLRGLIWERCLCYIDDVVVFGNSFETALKNLEIVLKRLRKANLKLKPSKCVLFQTEVLYLGHVVCGEGIKCDPKKLEAVKSWPVPKSVPEVRSFLGLAGYYCRFIPTFSSIASPLTRMTRKGRKFDWNPSCQKAFEILKEKLITSPVLTYPDRDSLFVLDTDASDTGIGAVLSQIQDGEEKVISYASKTLNRSQERYCTTYKELLAVVSFVKTFRHYLWGRKFIVRTDHASLVWLRRFKNPEGVVARWIAFLETYDFEIQHRKGSLHTNADSLSRVKYARCKRTDCPSCEETVVVSPVVLSRDGLAESKIDDNISSYQPANVSPVLSHEESYSNDTSQDHISDASQSACESDSEFLPNWLQIWSHDQLVKFQSDDPDIGRIVTLKQSYVNKPPKEAVENANQMCKTLWGLWESLKMQNDLLYYEWHFDDRIRLLLVAPKEIKKKIFTELHSQRIAGHLGRDRSISAIKRRFFWPGMRKDIARWCRQCDTCARAKPGPGLGRHPLQQKSVGAPLDRIGIDIVGNCPITEDGNEYIMVICDYFTKWVEAYAIPDHTALTVADKLVTEFVCRFGTPKQIHTDQGREFESILFQKICEKLGIEKTHTTPFRPQSDGLVERFNQTLQRMLSMFVNENRNDWDDHLPYVLMAYRASVQESTKCTPNSLMLGREISCPLDLMVGLPPEIDNFNISCHVEYYEWLKESMNKAFDRVHENLKQAAVKQKKYYDIGLKVRQYEVGEFIWRWYPPLANIKLGLGWTGPFKVIEKLTDYTYKVQKGPNDRLIIMHVDHMKPYEGISPPNWSIEEEEEEVDNFVHSEILTSTPISPDISLDLRQAFETPKKTRCGRTVRPPVPFTPD
ncbi:hypothetical protein FSP39_003829 [Pinctada imbricata]|uniref:Gag3-Pol3 n=1 Tax=Pinctada imbricata TaxID=66713 RepID=A0AA88YHB9_PINIB|nr:hypothetical protein FSP39_003829 [Pinctada imbricata]